MLVREQIALTMDNMSEYEDVGDRGSSHRIIENWDEIAVHALDVLRKLPNEIIANGTLHFPDVNVDSSSFDTHFQEALNRIIDIIQGGDI